MPLHRRLAAKRARVAGVLANFHLLDLFAEGGAVSVVEGVSLGGSGVGLVGWLVLRWEGNGREREGEGGGGTWCRICL